MSLVKEQWEFLKDVVKLIKYVEEKGLIRRTDGAATLRHSRMYPILNGMFNLCA